MPLIHSHAMSTFDSNTHIIHICTMYIMALTARDGPLPFATTRRNTQRFCVRTFIFFHSPYKEDRISSIIPLVGGGHCQRRGTHIDERTSHTTKCDSTSHFPQPRHLQRFWISNNLRDQGTQTDTI